MGDSHGKPERPKDNPNFVFTQQKLLIEIDRDEVKEHTLAKPPKEQGKRDKKKTTIQVTPLMSLRAVGEAISRQICKIPLKGETTVCSRFVFGLRPPLSAR